MSFRFVGTALSILGTSSASGYYLAGPMASPARPPTVVVPVSQPAQAQRQAVRVGNDPASVALAVLAPDVATGAPPARATATLPASSASVSGYAGGGSFAQAAAPPAAKQRRPYEVADGSYWQPRIWVGVGAASNPLTGALLSHEEAESGWVDAPSALARNAAVAEAPAGPAARPVLAAAPVLPDAASGVSAGDSDEPPPHRVPAAPLHTDPVRERHVVAAAVIQPAPAPAGEGGYRIHLASYRDRTDTDQEWAKLRTGHPGALDSLSPSTTTVTLPGKGTFVRLLAGPFESRAEADRTCAELRRGHQYCQPMPST